MLHSTAETSLVKQKIKRLLDTLVREGALGIQKVGISSISFSGSNFGTLSWVESVSLVPKKPG